MKKGEIDIIYGKNILDAEAVMEFQKNKDFEVKLSDPTSTRQILLNTKHDILSDKNVRKALQHMTNK